MKIKYQVRILKTKLQFYPTQVYRPPEI